MKLKSFLPKGSTKKNSIGVIQINGDIDSEMVCKVSKGLENVNKSYATLALVINSNSGSYGCAHLITQKINTLKKTHNLKVLTIAEDHVL